MVIKCCFQKIAVSYPTAINCYKRSFCKGVKSALAVLKFYPLYLQTTGQFEKFQEEYHPLGLISASQYIVRLVQA